MHGQNTPLTTGKQDFAKCLGHLAKATLHLAKASPSAALGEEHSAKILSVKSSSPSAKFRHLAKPSPSAKSPLGEDDGRWLLRPLRQVGPWHLAKASPSAGHVALGEEMFYFFKKSILRQVPRGRHLAKPLPSPSASHVALGEAPQPVTFTLGFPSFAKCGTWRSWEILFFFKKCPGYFRAIRY